MKKTGAWLVRYALEQMGIRFTFGIPGVHNTELYDELGKSELIKPVLVTHEAAGAFMADAVSRTSSHTGTLVIVPAAGAAYASAGIGEAYLDGIPMLVISGGTRTDQPYKFQLHEMDQQNFLGEITKKTYKVMAHEDIVPTLFEAYQIANQGEPGPVFIEIPVNLQLFTGEVSALPQFHGLNEFTGIIEQGLINLAVDLLASAKKPGIFVGWGARDASLWLQKIASLLNAPVSTTLQGLSCFPASHPMHVGMGFGDYSVPAASNAFKECDCLLAVGTRFAEIPTGSFAADVPENLIHVDINPGVFNANYPAKVAIEGDAAAVLEKLWDGLQVAVPLDETDTELEREIQADKREYAQQWLRHDSGDRVNPYRFFSTLHEHMDHDGYVVVDDGNHTFLAAELLPVNRPKHFISPTDFNCMGYAVPAAIGAQFANRNQQVVAIVGDGAFTMTCMELVTAVSHNLGCIVFVFSDGELSQISQAQEVPYNRKTCSLLGKLDVSGVAKATGTEFIALDNNAQLDDVMNQAFELAAKHRPVLVDVRIDYSKRTRFTEGVLATNLKRFDLSTKARFVSRALLRKVTG